MSDDKKYYYLKLKENFFESDGIKILEGTTNGYKYSNILLKLYLKSLKFNGALRLNEYIPYNLDMIATITGHDIDIVRSAIDTFEKLKLIETLENGTIYMLDIQNFIGKTSTEADRVRIYRSEIENEKGKLPLITSNSTNVVQMYDINTPELELEIEKELDIDIEKDSFPSDSNEYRLAEYLFKYIKKNNENAKEPNLKAWAKVFDKILRIDKRNLEEVKTIIRWCQEDEFWFKNILSPQALKKQYERFVLEIKKPIKKKQGTFNNYNQREYDFENLETQLLAKDKTEVDKEPFNLREQLENLKK